MVKEIILEENQVKAYKDKYAFRFRVRKENDGYYFFDAEENRVGPYERAFVDVYQTDIFACGFNAGEVDVYRTVFSGFEKEKIECTSPDFARIVKQLRIDREMSLLPNCKFIEEVNSYRLIKEDKTKPFFAKRDGYRRQLIQDGEKHIFEAQDGRLFCVNPNNVKPFGEYQLFDSFEEMRLNANTKGGDFNSLHGYNVHLAGLFNSLKFGRRLPNSWCLYLLEKLKEEIGLEEYQNLQEPVSVNLVRHRLFSMEEMIECLKSADLQLLKENIKQFGGANSKQPIIPAAIKEIEDRMEGLPSFVKFHTIKISYKDKHVSVTIPNDEETKNAINNPKLYDWQGATKFHEEQPEGYEMVKLLQEVRCKNFLPQRVEYSNDDDYADYE